MLYVRCERSTPWRNDFQAEPDIMTEPSIRDLGALSHLDALLATVGPVAGLRILDIGCGEGGLSRALAKLGAHVTGYDPFIAGTELTPVGTGSYRLVKAAADALPEPDHAADLVLFVFSLHHVPAAKLAGALTEARRVLAPSGRLYVAEPLAQLLQYLGLEMDILLYISNSIILT